MSKICHASMEKFKQDFWQRSGNSYTENYGKILMSRGERRSQEIEANTPIWNARFKKNKEE